MNIVDRIERYSSGVMDEKELDEFWIELLKKPDYIDLLEMYLLVKEYFERENKTMGLSPRACL